MDASIVSADLTDCELVIERGLKSFVEVGQALFRIRDGELYKLEFATFEDYCRERWDFSRSYVHRIVEASSKCCQLATIGAPTPSTESQARELAGLQPGEAQEVMEAAHRATGGNLTAKAIKQARQEYENSPPPPPPMPRRDWASEVHDLEDQIADLQEACRVLSEQNKNLHNESMMARHTPPQGGEWAEHLLSESGPLARSVYRSLAKVLHPDGGGSAVLMDQLSKAKEQVIDK